MGCQIITCEWKSQRLPTVNMIELKIVDCFVAIALRYELFLNLVFSLIHVWIKTTFCIIILFSYKQYINVNWASIMCANTCRLPNYYQDIIHVKLKDVTYSYKLTSCHNIPPSIWNKRMLSVIQNDGFLMKWNAIKMKRDCLSFWLKTAVCKIINRIWTVFDANTSNHNSRFILIQCCSAL